MEPKETLDRLYHLYKGKYLESDPVSLVHRYRSRQDIEIAALLSALFAFGRADLIIRAVGRILEIMGKRPSRYLAGSSHKKIIADFKDFQYRFVKGPDLAALLLSLKACLAPYGTLEAFLRSVERPEPVVRGQESGGRIDDSKFDVECSGYGILSTQKEHILRIRRLKSHPLKEERVWRLCVILRQSLYERGVKMAGENKLRLTQGFSILLADPLKSSACKRWFLFFRWMARKDEIDFGIWKFLGPKELIMPVDTHIARIGALIGLTKKRAAGAGMVKEITDNLRKCNPEDPLKYDFALTRLGILKECPRKREPELCRRCPIGRICVME